jgi:hypothetical protein
VNAVVENKELNLIKKQSGWEWQARPKASI